MICARAVLMAPRWSFLDDPRQHLPQVRLSLAYLFDRVWEASGNAAARQLVALTIG
jgi:hypothetical protein